MDIFRKKFDDRKYKEKLEEQRIMNETQVDTAGVQNNIKALMRYSMKILLTVELTKVSCQDLLKEKINLWLFDILYHTYTQVCFILFALSCLGNKIKIIF
jgi:hypothetical protein